MTYLFDTLNGATTQMLQLEFFLFQPFLKPVGAANFVSVWKFCSPNIGFN